MHVPGLVGGWKEESGTNTITPNQPLSSPRKQGEQSSRYAVERLAGSTSQSQFPHFTRCDEQRRGTNIYPRQTLPTFAYLRPGGPGWVRFVYIFAARFEVWQQTRGLLRRHRGSSRLVFCLFFVVVAHAPVSILTVAEIK